MELSFYYLLDKGIFILTHLIFIFSFYCMQISQMKENQSEPYMLYLPAEAFHLPELQELLAVSRKKIHFFFYFLLAASSVYLFLSVALEFLWLTLCCVFQLLYGYRVGKDTRAQLLSLKSEHNWKQQQVFIRKVDLNLKHEEINKSMISCFWYFLPPVMLAVLFSAFDIHSSGIAIWITAPFLGLFLTLFFYFFIRRQPNRTWCKNENVNQQLNQYSKYLFSLLLFYLNCFDFLTFMALFLLLQEKSSSFGFIALIVMLMGILLCLAVYHIKKYDFLKKNLLASEKLYEYPEEDYWHLGLFGMYYSNPYDPHLIKESNQGSMNFIFNSAKPQFKIFIIVFVLIVGIPVSYLTLWPSYLSHTRSLSEMTLTEEFLNVNGPLYQVSIPVEQIQKLELTDNLGPGTKVMGTATWAYGTGHFRYDNYGDTQNYLSYHYPPFLVVYTDKTTYLVNSDDPEQTQKIYHQLLNQIS